MMEIKDLRVLMGLTQKQFAEHFDIPQRTVQEWEQGRRNPPEYIPTLLERIWRLETTDQ